MKRKRFYETTLTVKVLSRGTITPCGVEKLHYLITDGGCSGSVSSHKARAVTKAEMVKLLVGQGCDADYVEVM